MSTPTQTPAKKPATAARTIGGMLLLLLGVVVPAFAQTAVVMPEPKIQFFDNNGDPLNGGKLFSYLPGTTTPLETCTTSSLTAGACSVANTNPVTLDTAGRASVFLRPAVYKFILQTSAGVQIWSQDNVTSTQYLGTGTASTGTFFRGDYGWSRLTTVVTTTSTGTQTNFDPGIVGNTLILANNATALTINGFAPAVAQWDGQRVCIVSKNVAGQVNLTPQATSTAGNRLLNVITSGDTPLAAGSGAACYDYDLSTARWRLTQHEQGAWITPTFAGGTYTASGGGSWTVGAGDVGTFAYRVVGRTLQVSFQINTSTVAGTVSSLNMTIPGSYVSAKVMYNPVFIVDAGTGNVTGLCNSAVASGAITCTKTTAANFTAGADITYLFGQLTVEVQ